MAGRTTVPPELWLLKSCRWVPVQLLQLFFISLGLITQLVKDTSSRASPCVFAPMHGSSEPVPWLCKFCRLCRHVRVGWTGEMAGWCTSVPNINLETEHSLDPETGSEDSSYNLHIALASSSAMKSLLMSLKDTGLLNDPVLFQPQLWTVRLNLACLYS